MHVRRESQPTSGKAHPLPQVTAWTTTLRVTAVAQPFPKMRLGKGVKWQRVGPFVESESTLSARDLQGIRDAYIPDSGLLPTVIYRVLIKQKQKQFFFF